MYPFIALIAACLLAVFPVFPVSPVSPAHARSAAQACADAAARVRPGPGHAHDRNELTPAEVTAVERELLALLGLEELWPGRPQEQDTARLIRRRIQVRIPVYFHVLHDGESGKLTRDRINAQIRTMDQAYGGGFGGNETGFDFVLKDVTWTDNADWYGNAERNEAAFKKRLHTGGPATLNLYSAHLGGEVLGWATFPWRHRADPTMDGVVVHAESLPGGGIPGFDQGFTAVHEIGHWLGLYHTFQDGCAKPGDRVADTPPEQDPTEGCPLHKDTCAGDGSDPVHNFMDYSHDTCMTEFTKGQSERIHKVWNAYRAPKRS